MADLPEHGLESAEQSRQQDYGAERDDTDGEYSEQKSEPAVHGYVAKAPRLVAASEIPPADAPGVG